MCGIAGAINFQNLDATSESIVKSFSKCISHRGPDADGFYIDQNIAFAHRRLSIIDIDSNSNQPMFSKFYYFLFLQIQMSQFLYDF